MKIYTRRGDDGTTRLGDGSKTGKDSLRVETYGTVDELNSNLGVVLAAGVDPAIVADLVRIQGELFVLGAVLATPGDDSSRLRLEPLGQDDVDRLEGLIDRLDTEIEPLRNFILPGGSEGGARLHLARTVCRRAERLLVALSGLEDVDPACLRYLNRLSDALFTMARYENARKGVAETAWKGR